MSSLYAALSAAPLALAAALLAASATAGDATTASAASAAQVASAFAAAATTALALATALGALSSAGAVNYDFSLPRELGGLLRAALYDRSALGDALAPLRPSEPPPNRPFVPTPPAPAATDAATDAASDAATDADSSAGSGSDVEPPVARRYLPATPHSVAPVRFVANRRALDRYEAARGAKEGGHAADAWPGGNSRTRSRPERPLGRLLLALQAGPTSKRRDGVSASQPLLLPRSMQVEPCFRALFADERYSRYRVAMAYLGPRWGVGAPPTRQRALQSMPAAATPPTRASAASGSGSGSASAAAHHRPMPLTTSDAP